MKYFLAIAVAAFFLTGLNVYAEDGEGTFKSLHCNICHKPDTGKTFPSLKDIAAAYKGREDQLLKYFKGESESVVNPQKMGSMKSFIEKTKKLEDDQRQGLADFILSH